jgi:NAD(P)-dependent dehydrogenase (short-subunit alcohol dehydrogenase family)
MRPTPATGATTGPVPVLESPKVAIVTGPSQGIGAGVAAALRRAGYAVVGSSRSIAPATTPTSSPCRGTSASLTLPGGW